MRLVDTIILNLDPIHINKINLIDDFDFSKTAKKVNHDLDGVTAQYLLDGIENLKRYYVVALLDPLNEHAVSRCVDPFWHAHILHTKEYMRFCDSIFGQYIHHEPLDLNNKIEVQKLTTLYNYTKDIYKKMFSTVSDQWWPAVDDGIAFAQSSVICRHIYILNTEIRSKSLFPHNVLLQAAA